MLVVLKLSQHRDVRSGAPHGLGVRVWGLGLGFGV